MRRLYAEAWTATANSYELLDGRRLEISHYGQALSVGAGALVERPIPVRPRRPRPVQPAGRAPLRRAVYPPSSAAPLAQRP